MWMTEKYIRSRCLGGLLLERLNGARRDCEIKIRRPITHPNIARRCCSSSWGTVRRRPIGRGAPPVPRSYRRIDWEFAAFPGTPARENERTSVTASILFVNYGNRRGTGIGKDSKIAERSFSRIGIHHKTNITRRVGTDTGLKEHWNVYYLLLEGLLIHLIRLAVNDMKDLSHLHRCYRFSVSFPQRERQNGNSFHYLAPRPEAPLWNMLIPLADFKSWREGAAHQMALLMACSNSAQAAGIWLTGDH